MARKIFYLAPVERMSGKWAQSDVTTTGNDSGRTNNRFIISQSRRRQGASGLLGYRNYFAYRTESNIHPLSADELRVRQRFSDISALVRAAYMDETKYREYLNQWQASGRKVTLRKFIWDAETEIYDRTEP